MHLLLGSLSVSGLFVVPSLAARPQQNAAQMVPSALALCRNNRTLRGMRSWCPKLRCHIWAGIILD